MANKYMGEVDQRGSQGGHTLIRLEQLVDGKTLMSGRCGKEVGLEGIHMQMKFSC